LVLLQHYENNEQKQAVRLIAEHASLYLWGQCHYSSAKVFNGFI